MSEYLPDQEDEKQFERLLDFELDKTHQAVFEAGNMFSKAFFTYMLLLSITALFTFGQGVEDKVSIPFVDLKVNKSYAAVVTLFLSCTALFWSLSTYVNCALLEFKFGMLLGRRYPILAREDYESHLKHFRLKELSVWHMLYPSPYISVINAAYATPILIRVIFFILAVVFFVVLIYAAPLVLAWHIGKAHLSLWIIVALIPSAAAHYTFAIHFRHNLKEMFTGKPNKDKVGFISDINRG